MRLEQHAEHSAAWGRSDGMMIHSATYSSTCGPGDTGHQTRRDEQHAHQHGGDAKPVCKRTRTSSASPTTAQRRYREVLATRVPSRAKLLRKAGKCGCISACRSCRMRYKRPGNTPDLRGRRPGSHPGARGFALAPSAMIVSIHGTISHTRPSSLNARDVVTGTRQVRRRYRRAKSSARLCSSTSSKSGSARAWSTCRAIGYSASRMVLLRSPSPARTSPLRDAAPVARPAHPRSEKLRKASGQHRSPHVVTG